MRLVERILSARQRDADVDVYPWESELDGLVYDLYDLTPSERELVEASVESKKG
jgi:hypothetical protein